VMCRVMMVDVEPVRRRDGRWDQLTVGQRQRCGLDTTLHDRGGLDLGGRLTLRERVSREEGVAVAVAVETVVAAAVVAVADARVGQFALGLMILLRLNCCGDAFD
jgi:hypothetical protein